MIKDTESLNRVMLFNRIFVLLGCAAPAAWLWVLFLWPAVWSDGHGYNQSIFLIVASLSHLVIGFLLVFAAQAKILSFLFAWSVFSAPLFHLLGSFSEPPLGFVLFVTPAALALIAGIHEWLRSPD